MNSIRHFSLTDRICISFDQALRAFIHKPQTTGSLYPAESLPETKLSVSEQKLVASFMRINHAGEICAQGLYHGQGLVSRSHETQVKMQQAAIEEGDHLVWCKRRLDELESHPSYLNILWYTGSFLIGMTAGIAGDGWSLGFVAETEKQVVQHLEKHLKHLPPDDQRSLSILSKMAEDEAAHRTEALNLGAKELPRGIRKLMSMMSKVMVKTAAWV